jgi:hypothetical protein
MRLVDLSSQSIGKLERQLAANRSAQIRQRHDIPYEIEAFRARVCGLVSAAARAVAACDRCARAAGRAVEVDQLRERLVASEETQLWPVGWCAGGNGVIACLRVVGPSRPLHRLGRAGPDPAPPRRAAGRGPARPAPAGRAGTDRQRALREITAAVCLVHHIYR